MLFGVDRRYVSSGGRRLRLQIGGLGINVLSTPAGILVDRDAKQRGVGGELLCSVW